MLKIVVYATFVAYVYASATVQQGTVVLNTNAINGNITFTKTADGVKVEGTINGLPVGKHGFHIHEKGDLRNGCLSAGGHFNPTNSSHGAPADKDRHVGDLGNIVADAKGVAIVNITDKLIALEGDNNIVGLAVVVHADEDDLGTGGQTDSKTTGHAGARLACGVIGIVDETPGTTLTAGTTTDSPSGASFTAMHLLPLLTTPFLILFGFY